MNILVLSCSPKRETSLTYHTFRFLEKMFSADSFRVHFTANGTFPDEAAADCKDCDLILFLASIFHFSTHSSMLPLFLEMTEKLGKDAAAGKAVTFLSTSGKNGEYNAHDFMRRMARHSGMRWIPSLSLDDVSVLCDAGREELYCWFRFVRAAVDQGESARLKEKARVVILDTFEQATERSESIRDTLKQYYQQAGAEVREITLRNHTIRPCTACCSCYTTRKCVIQDDFEAVVDDVYLNTDIIVYTGKPAYGTFGRLYKQFTERHMQYGRAGEINGIISLFLCDTKELPMADDLAYFEKHQSCIEALGHGFLVGFFGVDDSLSDIQSAAALTVHAYNSDVMPQNSGLGVGLDLQFARLAERIRALEPADYEDYRKRGFYEPAKIETHARPVFSAADGAESRKNRTIPYNMMLLDFDGKVTITERRPLKGIPYTARKQKDAEAVIGGAEEKSGKRGLFGFRKK